MSTPQLRYPRFQTLNRYRALKKVASETATTAMKNVKELANSEPVQNAKKVATETATSLFGMVTRGVSNLLAPSPRPEEKKSAAQDQVNAREAGVSQHGNPN